MVNSLEPSLALLATSAVVMLAGVVRGAIGFGFSALVVASCSMWMPAIYVVNAVVMLEMIASVMMLRSTAGASCSELLKPLFTGSILLIPFGVWLLATLESNVHLFLVSVYLIGVALLTSMKVQFKSQLNARRLVFVGAIAGFFSGLSGIGGVFIAMFLNGSRVAVADIRATMSHYFFMTEAVFLVSSWMNDLISMSSPKTQPPS